MVGQYNQQTTIVCSVFVYQSLEEIDYLSEYRFCLGLSFLAIWVSYLGIIESSTSQEETRNVM